MDSNKCKSIWIRARHNAFAHKVEMEGLNKFVLVEETLMTFFIIVPIFLAALGLHFITAGTQMPQILGFDFAIWVIVSNTIALYMSMISKSTQFRERLLQNQKSLSGYQLIAQKIRRLDDDKEIDDDERKYLIRHLEESFETHKSYANEPSDKAFVKGKLYMAKLPSFPFGITKEDF